MTEKWEVTRNKAADCWYCLHLFWTPLYCAQKHLGKCLDYLFISILNLCMSVCMYMEKWIVYKTHLTHVIDSLKVRGLQDPSKLGMEKTFCTWRTSLPVEELSPNHRRCAPAVVFLNHGASFRVSYKVHIPWKQRKGWREHLVVDVFTVQV